MLSGDSRSNCFGSGGVDIFRLAVDDGTTLPEIDLPFAPNGTGGLRTPDLNIKQNIRFIKFIEFR